MSKTKILLVDDKKENLLALEGLIAADEVEVLSALSANDALALLLDHDFALALLDVQMPEVNGFELARLMRSAERSRRIPIIFVTASQGGACQIFEGYEKGAVDFLLKPLDPHIVRSKIRVFVELDQKTKALEQKLLEVEALRKVAENASLAKSRFLSNVTHEIRTPLGAVLGFAQLLKLEGQSQEDRINCISAIERNGELLLQLVDDVLDLSKIEAEKIEVERSVTPLSDFIADFKAVHSHKAREKGISLKITTEGLLPKSIVTDSLRLKQILNNIVGNAIKFTDQGGVAITVFYDARRRLGQLCFSIKDTGCGLSHLEVGRIFKPFMQADSSTTRRYGGTGLGLNISKQLAILLGGDVTLASSQPGVGSTFVVAVDPGRIDESDLIDGALLLMRRQARGNSRAEIPVKLAGVHVLVADDAKDNRQLMSRLLALAGAHVETAADGDEAVEMALANSYDVILMDIQMPGTDGYQATSRLRRQGYRKPIIALTAHAMKDELTRCLEAGCDQHLSKPVDHRNLIASIAAHAKNAEDAKVQEHIH